MTLDRRGHNAVPGKQGFQEVHRSEPRFGRLDHASFSNVTWEASSEGWTYDDLDDYLITIEQAEDSSRLTMLIEDVHTGNVESRPVASLDAATGIVNELYNARA